MTTPETLYSDILTYCRSNTDPAMVKKYSRYFKEDYDAYGLTYALLQAKVKEILENPEIDLEFVLKISRLLIPGTKYEEPSFALMLVKAHKKHYSPVTFEEIGHWFSIGIRNWAHTDALCSEILSEFLLKNIVPYTALSSWRTGKNKFQRRAVPVSLIKLVKETRDCTVFLPFIEPLMMDPEREVHQGMGWFLREAWKIQPQPVEEFLLKYRNTAPRLIFQYATEKMKTEAKERFRRDKK